MAVVMRIIQKETDDKGKLTLVIALDREIVNVGLLLVAHAFIYR